MVVTDIEDGFEWFNVYGCKLCGEDSYGNDSVSADRCSHCGHNDIEWEEYRRPPECLFVFQEEQVDGQAD